MDFCHSSNVHHLHCKHSMVNFFAAIVPEHCAVRSAANASSSSLLQMLLDQACCKCLWLYMSTLPSEIVLSCASEADSVC